MGIGWLHFHADIVCCPQVSRSLLAVCYITSALLTVYCCGLVNSCHASSKRQQHFIGKENSLCVLLVSKLHRQYCCFLKSFFSLGREMEEKVTLLNGPNKRPR